MVEGNKIKRIGVIGPGMMGHAIAQEFVAAGFYWQQTSVSIVGENKNGWHHYNATRYIEAGAHKTSPAIGRSERVMT